MSHDGLIYTLETYKNVVKMTFAKGEETLARSRLDVYRSRAAVSA